MAFTSLTETNNGYNPDYEGVPPDQLLRLGLSPGFQLDAGRKALGQANGSSPMFTFTGTTTAIENGSFTLNLVTATRSVLDPQSSPTNFITKTIGGLAGALTTGTVRSVTIRAKQTVAGVVTCFWTKALVTGAATPVVANAAMYGTKNNASDTCTLVAAAGSIRVNVNSAAASSITWQVDVFVDDPF